jgi:quercetin dioxygenase-like cupin family protein
MRPIRITGIGVALAILVASAVALAHEKSSSGREIIRLASEMQFTEPSPGVSKAVLWGDPARGPYGTVNRFSKGTRSALHTHSHDIKVVVISGTFVYDSGTG